MALSRAMTAVVARTVTDTADTVSVAQLRILVMLYFKSPQNLTAIARELGVDRSNASRPADKLVTAALVRRAADPDDRRSAALSLTSKGRRLVESIMDRRRRAFEDIVAQLDPDDQKALGRSLEALLEVDWPPNGRSAGTGAAPILPWIR